MITGALHLIKLCVGAEGIDDLIDWRKRTLAEREAAGLSSHMYHTTRMWPRRQEELFDGGSIYWIVKGLISVRQELAGFEEEIGSDGIRRCRILMKPEFVLTELQPKRPFQGWRYLKAADAPKDLPKGKSGLAPELATDLADLGLL